MRHLLLPVLLSLLPLVVVAGTQGAELQSNCTWKDLKQGNSTMCSLLWPSSCTWTYLKQGNSTMCEFWDNPNVTISGVSRQHKEIILREHNKYRASAYPRAANMQKMYWDDNIAELAQKWANTCATKHDANHERRVCFAVQTHPDHDDHPTGSPKAHTADPINDDYDVPSSREAPLPLSAANFTMHRTDCYGFYHGQNIARGPYYRDETWEDAIYAWYREVEDFTFGQYAPDGIMVGHYTQIMRASASRIGCGFAQCPIGNIYICNYLSGNNMLHPYEISETNKSASKCPKSADNGLCDCGGKACYNGGVLDINKHHCSCQCQGIFHGSSCEKMDCRIPDPWFCGGTGPGSISEEGCLLFTNVPHTCPHMCGVCPSWEEIQQQYCGKVCENGGSMNINTCVCRCALGFVGDTCNQDVCELDNHDPSYCNGVPVYTWQPEDCMYVNVKADCPYMCSCIAE